MTDNPKAITPRRERFKIIELGEPIGLTAEERSWRVIDPAAESEAEYGFPTGRVTRTETHPDSGEADKRDSSAGR